MQPGSRGHTAFRNFVRLALLVVAVAVGRPAVAGQPRDLDLPRFTPAPAGDRFFGVPSPFTPGHAVLHGGAILDYAHDPLVLTDAAGDTVGHVVQHQALLPRARVRI